MAQIRTLTLSETIFFLQYENPSANGLKICIALTCVLTEKKVLDV